MAEPDTGPQDSLGVAVTPRAPRHPRPAHPARRLLASGHMAPVRRVEEACRDPGPWPAGVAPQWHPDTSHALCGCRAILRGPHPHPDWTSLRGDTGVCDPPPRGAGVGVTGGGVVARGPSPCRLQAHLPRTLSRNWALSGGDARLAPCKETLGTEGMGMPPAPWVTPVTVGRAHLGGRWLTVRAPTRVEAPSPQWQGSEGQVGHLMTAQGSQVLTHCPGQPQTQDSEQRGLAPSPSHSAPADPTEVLWALGVGVPGAGVGVGGRETGTPAGGGGAAPAGLQPPH